MILDTNFKQTSIGLVEVYLMFRYTDIAVKILSLIKLKVEARERQHCYTLVNATVNDWILRSKIIFHVQK